MYTRQRSMRRTGVRRLLYPSLLPVLPLLALLCSVTILTVAAAQAGDRDPTFDGDGIAITDINSYDLGNDLAIQTDGKIVVVGGSGTFSNTSLTVTRYNSDGSLDAGFGSGGVVVTAVGDSSIANAVALQSDGKILVVGGDSQWFGSSHRMIVVRYSSDGALDNTFGSGGIVVLAIGGFSGAEDVVIQPDGKIVVAGYSYIVAASFTFVRLNPDGSFDSTFDNDGVFVVPQSANARPTYGRAVALQTDGKIVAAGFDGGGQTSDIAVIRCNSDGSLDSTFGSGGVVFTNISDQQKDTANDLAIQPDGKIVVVGTSAYKTNSVAVLARYNTDGSLDTSFGKNGRVAPPIYVGAAGSASGVALQADGKILIAQGRDLLLFATFNVSRYETNGSLDNTFGRFGTVTAPIGYVATAAAVALQPDGRIVAAGTGNFRSDNPTLEIRADVAGDGQDKFRMQIWTDANDLIYDNQFNAPQSDDPTTVLGGGSIVIHQ